MLNFNEVRSDIYDLISSLIPHDLQEEEDIEFVKEWINSGAEIFRLSKPNHPPIHLVSYFVLIERIYK